MSDQNTAVAERRPASVGIRGVEIADMEQLWRFAGSVAKSGFAPKGVESQDAIFVAIQMGMEVGLPPMASLQNIAVINGRPTIWGDAQLAVARGTGDLEEFCEWFEASGERLPRNPSNYTDDVTAVCHVKRRGQDASEVAFSVADAKRAGLWGKQGPWTQYPFRMLKSRARSFNLRDNFGDALKGIMSTEEASDIVLDVDEVKPARNQIEIKPAKIHKPEPTPAPPPDPDPKPAPSARDQLAQIMRDAGADFSDLVKFITPWESKLGFTAPADFAGITEENAAKLIARPQALSKGLEASAKERGGK